MLWGFFFPPPAFFLFVVNKSERYSELFAICHESLKGGSGSVHWQSCNEKGKPVHQRSFGFPFLITNNKSLMKRSNKKRSPNNQRDQLHRIDRGKRFWSHIGKTKSRPQLHVALVNSPQRYVPEIALWKTHRGQFPSGGVYQSQVVDTSRNKGVTT